MGADEGNAVYAQIGEGRLLERPVYVPELLEGSVYLYYSIQAPRERPLGYSTTAPPEADRVARRLRSGKLDPADARRALRRPLPRRAPRRGHIPIA